MVPDTALEARDLRLVQAIAEQGGVTRAARRLHLSQSAVSHQLANLEARLGVRLFERVRRRMVITAAGHRLVALAEDVLPRLARAQAELLEVSAPQRLRVCIQCYTGYHWLPRVLEGMAASHPGLEVDIAVEATRDPVAAMRDDRLDLALCCFPVPRSFVSTPVFEDETVLVLPANHPAASLPRPGEADVLDDTLFIYDLPPSHEALLVESLFPTRAAEARIKRVPLTEAILELVRAGHGVSLMSRWSLGPHLARGDLVTRPVGLRRPWSVVRPRSSPFEPMVPTLVELLRTAMPLA